MDQSEKKPASNTAAQLPIGILQGRYLGMGLVFEYGLHIDQGF